ncbi:DUF6338 family protein [Bradyrhizobium sp. BR 1433]|uniref:DUF6338 family protein n=1 Tax=Bradyrhizobium sp. BR 1433 TaxID=3447967 RepID=UPI003EE7D82E
MAKIDAIYVALVFIVPGYVFLCIRNQFVVGQGKLGKEQLLSYVTVSGVNFALWGWIIYFAYQYEAYIPVKAVAWITVIIAIPAISGAAMGVCNQRDYFRKAFHRAGLTPSHSVPSAWDYKFSRSPGEWVLVTLKSGTRFAGWWAGRSFASDAPSERDLLIEQVYEIPDDGPWTPTRKSVLIMSGEMQTIEFIPQEIANEQEATSPTPTSRPSASSEGPSAAATKQSAERSSGVSPAGPGQAA